MDICDASADPIRYGHFVRISDYLGLLLLHCVHNHCMMCTSDAYDRYHPRLVCIHLLT